MLAYLLGDHSFFIYALAPRVCLCAVYFSWTHHITAIQAINYPPCPAQEEEEVTNFYFHLDSSLSLSRPAFCLIPDLDVSW